MAGKGPIIMVWMHLTIHFAASGITRHGHKKLDKRLCIQAKTKKGAPPYFHKDRTLEFLKWEDGTLKISNGED